MGTFATPRAKWRGRLPCALHVLDRFGRPPSKTRPKQNGPSSPACFTLARAAFWPLAGATSLFPAKREGKGSEKGSGQSVAGVARKPDFL